jgi:S-sulfosulfanyl-L-cysteine sulfohydrolase
MIEVEARINPDPEVDDLVRQTLAPYQEEMSTVVGKTATALNRGTTLETTMDNFLLQALLESTGAITPRLLLPNRASRASTGATASSTLSGA